MNPYSLPIWQRLSIRFLCVRTCSKVTLCNSGQEFAVVQARADRRSSATSGLPWQSVHDGTRLVHDPLRLAVVVEAPVDAINDILARHDEVRALFDNHWLHLLAIDAGGRIALRYAGGLNWRPFAAEENAA